jgi:hypothetical protein
MGQRFSDIAFVAVPCAGRAKKSAVFAGFT